MENHTDYILKLIESGLSIIPITEGKKNPHSVLGKTHDLLITRATPDEVQRWINKRVTSWGIAGGKVSSNLVTLDFDEKHYPGIYDLWYTKLSDDQKSVVDKCHKNQTRNGGTHLHYKTQNPQPTEKLARRLEWNEEENKEIVVTTAETKAAGGYALIPPSSGYATTQGNLLDLPLVTDEMHEEFIDILRVFNEVEDEPATEYEWKPIDTADGDRPGDRFNKQATWNDILEPQGWVETYKGGWTRPGKDSKEGISATTDYEGRNMLYVFSSNALPFIGPCGNKTGTGYSKFHAYALLNHKGDFSAAARAVNEKYPLSSPEEILTQYQNLLDHVPKDTPKESLFRAIKPLLELLAANAGLGEAEIYIQNKIKNTFGLKGDEVKSIIKDFKKMRTSIQEKILITKKKDEELDMEPLPTEDEKQVAEHLLKSPTLLYDILIMVKKLGVVGEERNILLHYIIFTSRMLKQPLSATVKGDSSSGKSYTLLTTIKLFPKSAYIDLTDATPQSFFYCPKDHFRHKIIVIFEKHGGERADYAIRTLQSEGKLKIQVTIKNPETGQFEAQLIEKEGPTGFVTTTTASVIHAENDTRNISMFPDQSSEQTSRVYESVDARYLGKQPINDTELKPWHHVQLLLEQLPIHIPFVKSFRRYFPAHIIRTRRDYGHFLAIVETMAFLHQKQRKKIELNGQHYIQATLADAYLAKVIVEESLSKSIYELPEKTIEVIETAGVLVKELNDQELDGNAKSKDTTLTITALAKKLGWDRDTVAKWMKPASKKGYFTVVTESKGSKGAEYKIEEKELPKDGFLPTIEQLMSDNIEESTDGIYDPLTGEIINLPTNKVSTDAPMSLDVGSNTV